MAGDHPAQASISHEYVFLHAIQPGINPPCCRISPHCAFVIATLYIILPFFGMHLPLR